MERSSGQPLLVYVQHSLELGSTAAVFAGSLTASQPAQVTVEYSRGSAAPMCTPVRATQAKRVQFALSRLQPGTLYRFHLAARSGSNAALGKSSSFVTLPPGHVAEGVRVGNVSVGRLDRVAALRRLRQPVAAPLRFGYAGAYWSVTRQSVGGTLPATTLLKRALAALPGAQLPAPRLTIDGPVLRGYAQKLAKRWSKPATAASLRLVGKHAVVTPANGGVLIVQATLQKQIVAALRSGSKARLTLPVRRVTVHVATPLRAVVVRLGSQTLTAYLNGKPILKTPVTTGRPALPTPIGSFHVQFRASPYVFHSPWPPGSAYYYPPTPVTWAMEFYEGDFLHDDPAEPAGDFGSDSQNGYFASHGCVHVPHDVMSWLYNWLPVGAPVIVSEN
jgi:lipoprotein-anchoring transpeptidase ErfK/SrfK